MEPLGVNPTEIMKAALAKGAKKAPLASVKVKVKFGKKEKGYKGKKKALAERMKPNMMA